MIRVSIKDRVGVFAEDKELAVQIRETILRPELENNHKVIIDFTGVEGATLSFVHAMIRALISGDGNTALDRISFKGCNKTIKGVISIVAEYSQLDGKPEASVARRERVAK